jgi:hypothetical protein
MGCDIHCYIEYHETYAWCSFGSCFNPGRNYSLFGRIAGVRDLMEEPVVRPRGRLDNLGYEAAKDSRIYVRREPGEQITPGSTSLAAAEKWVDEGLSTFSPDGRYVSHPDHHTHTWLTPNEFAEALKEWNGDEWGLEYRAMLAAMRSLESDGQDVRLVVWFDS